MEEDMSWIFGNDVIFIRIAEYLGTPDLKILRQTCKFLHALVNQHVKFARNIQLTICTESMEEGVVEGTSFPWRRAKLIVGEKRPLDGINVIEDVLSNVEDLEVRIGKVYFPNHGMFKAIFQSLPQFKYLKSLSLPIKFLETAVIPSDTMKSTVRNLKRFGLWGNTQSITPGSKQYSNYEANMEVLASLEWRLVTLEIDEGIPSSVKSKPLQRILDSTACTLQTLNLLCGLKPFGNIEATVLPRLRNIHFKLQEGEGSSRLAVFLNNTQDLEMIRLSFPEGAIDPEILAAIKSNSSKLTKLFLQHGLWLESSRHEVGFWRFLKNRIREFQISGEKFIPWAGPNAVDPVPPMGPNCESLVSQCIEDLGPSSTLKTLYLNNLRSSLEDNWEGSTISALSGFPHLRELKITECKDVLSDGILQAILSTMNALRVFHFGGGTVTDFGLTGEDADGEQSGKSIRDLINLRDLQIYGCPAVSLEGILKSVQFNELTKADLRWSEQAFMPDPALLEIARNNPALEQLERFIAVRDDSKIPDIRIEVMSICPRLTRIGCWYPAGTLPSGPGGGHGRLHNMRDCQGEGTTYRPSYGVLSTGRLTDFQTRLVKCSKTDLDTCILTKPVD